MRLFVVEPYFGGSHRQWVEGLARSSSHDVHLVTHDAQFWRWRMRGGAVTLADETARLVQEVGRPDAVVVSDMVNLAAYLGLARRSLGEIPIGLYMHENQLTYPLGPTQEPDEALSLVNWVSLVAADQIFFNSDYHRGALLAALPGLVARAPDRGHEHRLETVAARSSVLPVGIDLKGLLAGERPGRTGPPLILWNQRWDHDKAPRRFFAMLDALVERGVDFAVAIVGENERVDPREFNEARSRLGDRVVAFGFQSRADYAALLLQTDIVVSTADHEFFGVALVEAMAAGAVPLLPDRLSYPEILPRSAHARCLYEPGEAVDRLAGMVEDLDTAVSGVGGVRSAMAAYDWSALGPVYDLAFERLVESTVVER
jgi:glycosyltransferase involved in cell wall biosynthesis